MNKGALNGERYRVIVTTDIGGSDPDDFQSMAHYLLYADMFDTEGLISSAWGEGTVNDILYVIDQYEKDYDKLCRYSDKYPTPDALRAMTKQGNMDIAPYKGYSQPTEASEWIIQCAKKDDLRPLYLLMWGLLEDLAQALHDAPEIAPKLRVHYIGGPNKKWGPNAYEYIRQNFPDLWMIENNSSYRGWFNGGDQSDPWGNASFVSTFGAGHGALGEYFAKHLGGVIKMGDTPTVAWLLKGDPEVPEIPSWGGHYERVRDIPRVTYYGNTTLEDTVEVFGTLELVLQGPECDLDEDTPAFWLVNKGQEFAGYYCGKGEYRLRFVPKEVGEWHYTIKSDIEQLNGLSGAFRSVPESRETRAEGNLTQWWSDVMDLEWAEGPGRPIGGLTATRVDPNGPHMGAKTVNQWRREFLADFAARLERCK